MSDTYFQSVFRATHTAADDNKFQVVRSPQWLREANVYCYTNDAYYGDYVDQDIVFSAGDVLSFNDFNAEDLFFKNYNAGSNAVIKIIGIKMTTAYKQWLGVI